MFSFVKGWKLTLVILSVSPLLLFAAGMFAKVMRLFFCHSYETNIKKEDI